MPVASAVSAAARPRGRSRVALQPVGHDCRGRGLCLSFLVFAVVKDLQFWDYMD